MPEDLASIIVTGSLFLILLSIVWMIDAWPEIKARNEEFRARPRNTTPSFYRQNDPSPKRGSNAN